MSGFAVIAIAAGRGIFRARPIFGNAAGLTIGTGDRSSVIPWSDVGEPQLPLSSNNPIFRTYYVEILGRTKRVYFFAGRREVEQLESLRRARTASPS